MSRYLRSMELVNALHQAVQALKLLKEKQRFALVAALFLMAVVGFCTAQIPLTLGRLVDEMLGTEHDSLQGAVPALLTVAVFYLVREVLQFVRKLIVEGICTTVERDATVNAISRLFAVELSALGAEKIGALNGRLHRSVSGLVKLLKLAFLELIPSVFGAGFAVAAALSKNLLIGLITAAVIPISFAIIGWQVNSQKGVRIAVMRGKERIDGTVVEQLGGIETVRVMNTRDYEVRKVRDVAEDLRKTEYKHHIAMALFDAIKNLNEGAFHIAVMSMAIALSASGSLSPGDILTFSVLFAAVVNPLRDVHRIVDEAHESSLKTAEYFSIVGQPIDPSFDVGSVDAIDLATPFLIRATALNVRYAGTSSKLDRGALRNVDLTIKRGEWIGLAGRSGSGKTTFIRCLTRLVHPSSGTLEIGGVRIEKLSRTAIENIFGVVSQTPFLFSGTVAENIAYGCPGVTRGQIVAAAELAQIRDEIETLPNGFDYQLAERGGNLSGGQRQRIALARIFLKNPPILVLDEATSALDNTNERAVIEAVEAATKGRTVISIAHRLSSLRNTDRILVFDAGSVIEQGRFEELALKRNGAFAQLLREGGETSLATSCTA